MILNKAAHHSIPFQWRLNKSLLFLKKKKKMWWVVEKTKLVGLGAPAQWKSTCSADAGPGFDP